ncbi:MAG: galactose mutarotase [Tidjanibacter sp.]|nr:galactose mutarotase [Tidjanibacter sp.]
MVDIEQKVAGFTPEGDVVVVYTMRNSKGYEVELCNMGAAIVGIRVPDKEGNVADVALGYENRMDYVTEGPCMGKVPGRYANRIARGHFVLDDKEYHLTINKDPNSLHGGPTGFHKSLWEGRVEENRVVFAIDSPDGHEGYPSDLYVEAVYDWDDDNRLELTLLAQTNGATIINLTNHAYFNLAGAGQGDIKSHTLRLAASTYLPTDQTLIPTGEIRSVEGTPMDFRTAKPIGRDIDQPFEALLFGKGYDNCWPIDGYTEGVVREAALLTDPTSGRTLRVLTDQPSVQVYTGNWLSGCPMGKGGKRYGDYAGVAIECQGYPDAPNHPNFPPQVLRKGERYERHIIFEFGVE